MTPPVTDNRDEPRTLNVRQVGEELGISDYTVQKLIQSGLLAAMDIGTGRRSHFRIKRADLDAYVEQARSRTAQRFGTAGLQ